MGAIPIIYPAANREGLHMSIPKLSIEVVVYNAKGQEETKSLQFKSLLYCPMGIVRETRNNVREQLFRVLEWSVDPTDMVVVDLVPASELTNLLEKMQEASDVKLGESDGSSKTSSTSRSGARRSKPTSSKEDSA